MSLTYPDNLKQLLDWGATGIVFNFYERPDSQSDSHIETVMMPAPKDLVNPMDIKWEQSEMGATATAVKSALTGNDIDGWSIAGNVLIGGAKKLATMAGVSEGKVRAIEGQATGKISNPYIAMTFQSIGFRKYSMEFRFTPHNVSECRVIDNIVKIFRRTALPKGGVNSNGQGDSRIGYPGEIEVMYVGNAMTWLPLFKRSVIEEVQVSYSGQGHFATMNNGFPAETVLQLKFTENELVFSEDIITGGPSY